MTVQVGDAPPVSWARHTYRKTPAGVAEIAHRKNLHDGQKRAVLLLLDGRRSVREVAQTLRLDSATADGVVAELVALGMAEEVPATTTSPDLRGSPATEEIGRVFARYLGPLAQIVLAKQMAEAQDRADLIARLARHLTDESLRAAFVAEVSQLR